MQSDVRATTSAYFPTEFDKPIEIKNEYDLGQEIARRYLQKHGREALEHVIEDSGKTFGLGELRKVERPDGVDELYKKLDMHEMVGAGQGFADYLADKDVTIKESPEYRRTKMMFSSHWLLIGGQLSKS